MSLLVVPALVLAACGGDDDEVITQPGDTPTDPAEPTQPADPAEPGPAPGVPGGGPDGLVISIEHIGGAVTADMAFRRLPVAVLYEDGTSFTPGAVIAIYPGPAVYPVVLGQLTPKEIEALVSQAARAGLLEEVDYGNPQVPDAPDTRITVVVDGEAHVRVVPALGFDEQASGLDEEQAEARRRAQAFVAVVSEVLTAAETAEFLEPDRYRVQPRSPRAGEVVEGIEPNRLDWPLPDIDLAEGRCTALSGEAAEVLRSNLDRASDITVWVESDGSEWRLAIRPVLPHEPDC
jgi:hypothetical protein